MNKTEVMTHVRAWLKTHPRTGIDFEVARDKNTLKLSAKKHL